MTTPGGRHRAPDPQPWPQSAIAVACAAGALGLLAATVAIGTTVAPDAQASPPTCSTEGDNPCPPPAPADVTGLDFHRPIARSVTPTSVPSSTSTATAPATTDVSTPRPSGDETGIRPSSPFQDRSVSPGPIPVTTPVLEAQPTEQSPSPTTQPPNPSPTTSPTTAAPASSTPAATTTPSPSTPTEPPAPTEEVPVPENLPTEEVGDE